jgi:pectin methylesterase-like acyl-CoA thioesterase
VIVDGSYTGSVQTGSPGNPFDTVAEGIQAVYPDGSVIVRPGAYDEQLTVIKAALIRGDGSGNVVIGGQ